MRHGLAWASACGAMIVMLFPLPQSVAQSYPSKNVRMIAPFAPGGGVDVVARLLADKLGEYMGQQVLVDNRPGASGNIGTEMAKRAPADGHTILMTTTPFVVNPSMFRNLPFDVQRDFVPVSLVGTASYVLVVHPSVPAKSVKQLIALAKEQPGKLNYTSGGNGTNSHMASELLKELTGTMITQVSYRGGGPALVGIMSGEADLGFFAVEAVGPHLASGRLRALGSTGTKRISALPELPTIAEAGVPGYEFLVWYGVLAPAGTPDSVVTALNGYIVKTIRTPAVVRHFSKSNIDIVASSPAQFASYIKKELVRWAKVVREMKLERSR